MRGLQEIDSRLHVADLQFQGCDRVIASFILVGDGEVGIIETGPTTTLPTLLAAIDPFGGVGALTSIAVTHIHLDHSGAVGKLMRMAPKARCFVHSAGVAHVVDPSRLLRSAGRIYGDDMERLWGEVVAAPEDRVVPVDDGDVLQIAGHELQVVYTPGHAVHHIALYDPDRKAVFSGDVAGVRLPGFRHVRTPTPPPDIDLDLWHKSIERLRELDVKKLFMTHFGVHDTEVKKQYEALLARLDLWVKIVREGMGRGDGSAVMAEKLQEESDKDLRGEGADDMVLRQYDLASPYGMSVDGLVRYVKTHLPVQA